MCVINMMVFVCCQLKVSLTDGWTSCDDVTSSSQLHCRGDDRDDIDIVFDMSSSAAMIDSVHVMSSVFCYYVSSIHESSCVLYAVETSRAVTGETSAQC